MRIGWIPILAAALYGVTATSSAALSHKPAETAPALQAPACPIGSGTQLVGVEVFDGPIAEQAMLRPEEDSPATGHWPLAYVYKAGRTVNLRCHYADATIADRELRKPVRACRYAILKSLPFGLRCR